MQLPIIPSLVMTEKIDSVTTGNITMKLSSYDWGFGVTQQSTNAIPIFGTKNFLSKIGYGSYIDKSTTGWILPTLFLRRKGFNILNVSFDNSLVNYYSNLHFHGSNVDCYVDGASNINMFGAGTPIGPEIELLFKNNNNSAMTWYHAHKMFDSSPFVCAGMAGLVNYIDDFSELIEEDFIYGDNNIQLVAQDFWFKADGTQDISNIYTDQNRNAWFTINGIACLNNYNEPQVQAWLAEAPTTPDAPSVITENVKSLYHYSSRRNVKITILNGTTSWSKYYIGVQDKNGIAHQFYYDQTDQGYRNPILVDTIELGSGNRAGIMFDLDYFEDNEAYIFLYSFDLTANNGLAFYDGELVNTDDNNNPIPSQPVPHGILPIPKTFTQNTFLKISYKRQVECCEERVYEEPLSNIITKIRKTIFGCFYNTLKFSDDFDIENYQLYLNSNYYYNLPMSAIYPTHKKTPERHYMLFADNTLSQENEAVEAANANRVFVDCWNSEEFSKYMSDPQVVEDIKNGKEPSTPSDLSLLPTVLFKITNPTEYESQFMSIMCSLNYKLTINIGDRNDPQVINPLQSVTIEFESAGTNGTLESKPYNIQQWTNLINEKFRSTKVTGLEGIATLADMLTYTWNYKKFQIPYLSDNNGQFYKPYPDAPDSASVNSVLVKTINKTEYNFLFIGTWSLLNYFGKAFTAMVMPVPSSPPMTNCSCSGGCGCGPNCDCTETDKCCDGCNCSSKKASCCGSSNTMSSMTNNDLQTLMVQGSTISTQTQSPDANNNFSFIIGSTTPLNKPINVTFPVAPTLDNGNVTFNGQSSFTIKTLNISLIPAPNTPLIVVFEGTVPNSDGSINKFSVTVTMGPIDTLILTDPTYISGSFTNNSLSYSITPLYINPSTYAGFIDGFMNDNLMMMSVKENSEEVWVYSNMDNQDSHPFHFHQTSGFINLNDKYNQWLKNYPNLQTSLCYSLDTYPVPPQQSISFNLKFANYNSKQGKVPYLGYMYHCHFLAHHDMNMMNQFFVYDNKEEFF